MSTTTQPRAARSRTGPIDPVGADLSQVLRALKLSGLKDTLPERLALARQQQLGHAAFLQEIEQAVYAGAGFDDLLHGTAAPDPVQGPVDQQLRPPAVAVLHQRGHVDAAAERLRHMPRRLVRQVVERFEGGQHLGVKVPDRGAVHVEEHDCGESRRHHGIKRRKGGFEKPY